MGQLLQGRSSHAAGGVDSQFRRRGPRRSLHGTLQMFGMAFIGVGYSAVVAVKGTTVHSDFAVHSSLGYLALALCMVQVRSVGSQGRSPRHSGVTTPCVSCVYFAVRCRCLQVP